MCQWLYSSGKDSSQSTMQQGPRGEDGCTDTNVEGSASSRGGTKACLQRYRLASGDIMRVLRKHLSPSAVMEKAGIDECFFDVTAMVEEELSAIMKSQANSSNPRPPAGLHDQQHSGKSDASASEHPDLDSSSSSSHPDDTDANTNTLPAHDRGTTSHGGCVQQHTALFPSTTATLNAAAVTAAVQVRKAVAAASPDAAPSTGHAGEPTVTAAQLLSQAAAAVQASMPPPAFAGTQAASDGTVVAAGGGETGGGGAAPLAVGERCKTLFELSQRAAAGSVVLGGPLDVRVPGEMQLAAAAVIAARLRAVVYSELQYSMSAGIAVNKTMAKLGSSRNKPNKQTLLLPRAIPELMQELPLSKIWGLGGKLGTALETLHGATTAGQVLALPLEVLRQRAGRACMASAPDVPIRRWVAQIVRGICTDPVVPKGPPKSLMSAKSFEAVSDMAAIGRWATILAEELSQRLAADAMEHRRHARTLVVQYRGGSQMSRPRSVRTAMPAAPQGAEGVVAVESIRSLVLALIRQQPDSLPCVNISISATDFSEPLTKGTRSVSAFFKPAPVHTHATAHPEHDLNPAKRQRTPAPVATLAAKSKPADITNHFNLMPLFRHQVVGAVEFTFEDPESDADPDSCCEEDVRAGEDQKIRRQLVGTPSTEEARRTPPEPLRPSGLAPPTDDNGRAQSSTDGGFVANGGPHVAQHLGNSELLEEQRQLLSSDACVLPKGGDASHETFGVGRDRDGDGEACDKSVARGVGCADAGLPTPGGGSTGPVMPDAWPEGLEPVSLQQQRSIMHDIQVAAWRGRHSTAAGAAREGGGAGADTQSVRGAAASKGGSKGRGGGRGGAGGASAARPPVQQQRQQQQQQQQRQLSVMAMLQRRKPGAS
ncbi:MAG: hypothetical protein WDW38_003478 [Sanguina aurantia]